LAYGGLADSYISLAGWGFSDPSIIYPKAKRHILKALELDNSRGQFHATLGNIQQGHEWNWTSAEESYKLAISLDSNYLQVHIWYFLLASITGDVEKADYYIKKAIEMDPLSIIANFQLARHYLQQGDYSKALTQAQKTLDLDESSVTANWTMYEIYYAMGERDLAFKYYMKSNSSITGLIYVENPGLIQAAYERGGWVEAAQFIFSSIQSDDYVSPMNFARLYILMGNIDKALDYMERAYNQRDPVMMFVGLFPDFRSLHAEPRYQALLKKMKLPIVIS